MMNGYPLMGKKVIIDYYYERECELSSNQYEEVVTWVKKRFIDTQVGWVTGYRKKFNGVRKYSDELKYSKFIPTETVDCIMVALSPIQNSITVPLDNVVEQPENFQH